VSVEQSSTFVEPGSDNQMVLEIYNAGSKEVTLQTGQPIAKLFLMRVVDSL
jgi:deoxycytidine triphosphate deaminase